MYNDQRPQELSVGRDVLLVRENDYFLSLSALAKASSLSTKTLRAYLSDAIQPLPHYRPGGKVIVRWSEFLSWLQRYKVSAEVDINAVVQEIVDDLREVEPHRRKGRHIRQRRQESAG
jgi:hypothetical protein